jgi:glutathione S-transferase
MRQLEALADGVMEAAQALVREKARPAAQQSKRAAAPAEKVARGLDGWKPARRTERCADEVNLATISTACAIAYLNFRRVAPGWCATRPQLVKLVDALFQRASFARTEPPRT